MRLSSEVRNLVIFNTIMSVIFNFSNIFVNLYLWGRNHNTMSVILFNLATSVVLFFAYLFGSHYLYRFSVRFVMILACGFSMLSFALLYLYDDGSKVLVVVIIGAAVGVTQGLYWSANNAAIYFFLKSEQYPSYFSFSTVLSQLVTVCVPLVSSGVIYWFTFRGSFIIMGCLVVIALLFVLRLPKFSIDEPLFRNISYRKVFSKPGTSWSLVLQFGSGLLGQFQSFFSMIFIFTLTNNQVMVALLNFGYSVVVILGLFVYKRSNIKENVWLAIGILLLLLSYAIAMFNHPSLGILVVLLMQVGSLYYSASTGRQGYRLMMQGDVTWRTKVGIWYEVSLVLSRSFVLTVALFFRHFGDGAFIFLVVISTFTMFSIPYLQHKAIHEFEVANGVGAGM